MIRFFNHADCVIWHNGVRWDSKAVKKVLGIDVKCRQVDTLAVSWYLYPQRGLHGLAGWGEELGIEKPPIDDWENLSQEEYEHRCQEDVKINVLLWRKMYRYLTDIYGNDKDIWKLLDYLTFKMECASLQEEAGWHVDIDYAKAAVLEMEEVREKKFHELKEAMPPVPIYFEKNKPKRFLNKKGDYTKLGEEWVQLLLEHGLPLTHEEPIQILKGYEEPNPGSPEQVKSWLYSFGWVPQTFKYVKNKETGDLRAIPQVNQENGKGICESIKRLYEKDHRLELLDGIGVLNHRIPLIQGMIDNTVDGKLQARVAGLTNTLRFKHAGIVNLPKVEKAWGEYCRGMLVVDEGYLLCGSDMASLEDRIKQSYIYEYDPEYVDSMKQEDFDPHLTVAGLAGMLTEQQIIDYKNGDKQWKPVRDIAKNGNYACQYNAGPPRLVLTCGISLDQAKKLHKAYWKMNWAIKKVAESQVVKTVQGQMWLKNPVSGFWYSLRYMRDVFSTLVQGTASYVFDKWIELILSVRRQLTAQFHDEGVWRVKEESKEKMTELLEWSIKELNSILKLNRELGISIQYGKRYSQIH
jgi:hypothetical protein